MTASETPSSDEILRSIEAQTEDLCHIHDHITRIITNLDIGAEWFSGYDDPGRAKFDLEPMVRLFLYKHARDLNQSELARRLQGAAYVHLRLGFDRPISQQIISHNKRERFDPDERRLLKDAAEVIRSVCSDHDIIRTNEPALDPETVQHDQVSDTEIMDAVERATELGFSEFTADRASNAKYPLEAYFERQGYLNMSRAGTTTPSRRFARLSERESVPHGSSHNRTMKKVAKPDSQLTFDEFVTGKQVPAWKRIRDEVLEPFHAGVENILDELTDEEYDDAGFTEPVHAAIDITAWNFYASPFMSEKEARDSDREPIRVTINGKEKLLDPEHPDLVSGLKDSDERGYKFATITIIAENTPIVLGVEPVRDQRKWEHEMGWDVERTSRADIVERLLEQASRHVDIHKVFLDRGFSSKETRDVIDRRGLLYVLGKPARAKVDKENIEEIKDHDTYDSRIGHGTHEYGGREHDITYIYTPSKKDGDKYAVFTVNEHIDHHRAEALLGQYGQRMEIENEYKTIKKHFLPTTASKDFRIRFLYFVVGTLLYNVWRMANFMLRDAVDVDLGESPPILAGELIELVAFCLFDPPD
ncbi:transposase [Halorubrum saccharovorum]|uniref:Transposase n=1 Tax=Halorubrum saccharovorum TaxID=2248 RepID=A0A0F8CL81_9EURY|nr:transposase [Halorubrum saccharovorum]KKF39662.1 transposase [Halorubrum saccharovorum]